MIAAGHGAGFKVLLSVIGDKSRVMDPAYRAEYAGWVAGLAAAGADAIEVWNEPNIDHEWPEGQISAAAYTQLLQAAYNAIKGANGGTIVISARAGAHRRRGRLPWPGGQRRPLPAARWRRPARPTTWTASARTSTRAPPRPTPPAARRC